MNDPVILPTSNKIVDMSTICRHLLRFVWLFRIAFSLRSAHSFILINTGLVKEHVPIFARP